MARTRRQILRDLDRAREGLFPTKTCPASRHVHLIVEGLFDAKSGYGADLRRLGYEPEHMGESIASVLQGLWSARRWLKWEKLPPTKQFKHNGHWVPDLETIAAQGMSAGTAKTPKAVEGEARQPGPKDAPHE